MGRAGKTISFLVITCGLTFATPKKNDKHSGHVREAIQKSSTSKVAAAQPVAIPLTNMSNISRNTNGQSSTTYIPAKPENGTIQTRDEHDNEKWYKKYRSMEIKWGQQLVASDTMHECHTTYTLKHNERDMTLKQLFDDDEYMKLIEEDTKQFITKEWLFTQESRVLVKQRKCVDELWWMIYVQKVNTNGEYSPCPWLRVHDPKVTFSFSARRLLNREAPPPPYMVINPFSPNKATFTSETKTQEVDVEISKVYSIGVGVGAEYVNGDVVFKIKIGEYTPTKFVKLLDGEAEGLYPGDVPLMLRNNISAIKFTTAVIKVMPAGGDDAYSASLEGTPDETTYFRSKSLSILCVKDLLRTRCGLMRIVDLSTIAEDPIRNIVGSMNIGNMVKLSLLPDNGYMLFQSARESIGDISSLDRYGDIKDTIINDKKEDVETDEEGIVGNSCFRYRHETLRTGKVLLIRMCPGGDSFTFYIPDLIPLDINTIKTMLVPQGSSLDVDTTLQDWLSNNANQVMTIKSVKVTGTSSLTQEVELLPRLTDVTEGNKPGYKLINNLAFSTIRKTPIVMKIIENYDESAQTTTYTMSLSGGGDEDFLGYPGSFQITSSEEDGKYTVAFTLRITNNRLLMTGLKESQNDVGNVEADLHGYITPFELLRNVTLKVLTLNVIPGDGEFRFQSEAEMGDIKDASFELRLYGDTQDKTSTCIYMKKPGYLADIINAVHQETFFDQAWMGYNQIGFQMAPNDNGISAVCKNTDRTWRTEVTNSKVFGKLDVTSGLTWVFQESHFVAFPKEYDIRFEMRLHKDNTEIVEDIRIFEISAIQLFVTIKSSADSNLTLKICRNRKDCELSPPIFKDEWLGVRVTQTFEGKSYVYRSYVNGIQVTESTNNDAIEEGVWRIWARELPRNQPTPVTIRNVYVSKILKKIGVTVQDITFKNCEEEKDIGTTEDNIVEGLVENEDRLEKFTDTTKGCQFLKDKIHNHEISTTLYGAMDHNEMMLRGTATTIVDIADKMKLHVTHVTLATKRDDKTSILKLEGKLEFWDGTSKYDSELIIGGDTIKLRTKDHTGSGHIDKLRLYWTSGRDNNLEVYAEPVGIMVPLNDDTVEGKDVGINAGTVMRNTGSRSIITFDDRFLSKQFPPVSYQSTFYACKPTKRAVRLSRLLRVLGQPKVEGDFLRGALVLDLCVANNMGLDDMVVDAIGHSFTYGFHLRGTIVTDFGERFRRKAHLPFVAAPVFGGTLHRRLKMCVTLPVQRWGRRYVNPDDKIVIDNEDDADEIREQPIKDIEQEDRVVIDDYVCELNGDYKIEQPDEKSLVYDQGLTAHECVQMCLTYHQEDIEYDGVGYKDSSLCWCIKRMRYGTWMVKMKTCYFKRHSVHLVEMHAAGGEEENKKPGPEYCYYIPHPDGEFYAELKGTIITPFFKNDDMTLNFNQSMTGKLLSQPHGYWGDLFEDNLLGYFKITFPDDLTNLDNLGFKIEISFPTIQEKDGKKVQEMFELIWTEGSDDIQKLQQSAYSSYLNLQTFKKKVQEKTRRFRVREMIPHEQKFQEDSIRRARAMKSFARDCTQECGYARVAGWNVDNKCSTSNNGHSMSCLKYTKDANIASNVGCIANCEAERVQSHAEARQLHNNLLTTYSEKQRKWFCQRRGIAVTDKLETYEKDMWDQVEKVHTLLNKRIESSTNAFENSYLSFTYIETTVHTATAANPRCMTFSWKYNNEPHTGKKLCSGGFLYHLISDTYHRINKDIIQEGNDLCTETEEQNSDAAEIIANKGENEQSREILKLVEDFENCMIDSEPYVNDSAVLTGRNSFPSIPKWKNADFTIFTESTVESFNRRSPWSIARKRNVVDQLLHSKPRSIRHNLSTHANESDCLVARRTAIEYNDIASYIHKWTQEQQSAKRSLIGMKEDVAKEWQWKRLNITLNENKYDASDIERMNYWMDKTKDGMNDFVGIQDKALEKYNKESLPFIRKELEYVYTNDNHKTLRDFFTHRSVDGTNAFKRAKIETASPYTISDLSKTLLNITENGKTLEEISGPIEDVMRRTEVLHKRSIQCTL